MPSLPLFIHLALDRLGGRTLPRVPEPALVMADPGQAAAFEMVGREDGILAYTYLYHAIQASGAIRPGARVLDLGCGPAHQLATIARLNPEAHFVGIDASPRMLELGAETLRRCGVSNVELRHGLLPQLPDLSDAAFDVVLSTMTLHHLPDCDTLFATCAEIRRLLRPGGGLYLVDFGRLRRHATQRFFAHERAAEQPALFTLDYYNSLRAAFSLDELRAAAALCGGDCVVERTFLVPFLVVIRSRARAPLDATQRQAASAAFAALGPRQRVDLRDLERFFAHGGFPLAFRPW